MCCPDCKSFKVSLFSEDTSMCSHCGKPNVIAIYTCETCGAFWKKINNEVVKDYVVSGKDTQELFDLMEKKYGIEIRRFHTSMGSVVHKCLRCNEIAFEVADNEFYCDKCGFSWETLCGEEV